MESLRSSLRCLPVPTIINFLRYTFALPAYLARPILNDSVKPCRAHFAWMLKHLPWKDGWRGYWIGKSVRGTKENDIENRIRDGKDIDLVILFVHGGGFRIGRPTMHMDAFIGWLAHLEDDLGLRAIILSVRYGLAPQYKYPTSTLDVINAYKYLICNLNVPPTKIIISGDSAGAALVLHALYLTSSLAVSPSYPTLPRPSGLILISPLVTAHTTSPSWTENTRHDYIVPRTVYAAARDYIPLDHTVTTIFSPLEMASLDGWLPPRLLVILGGKEVMRDDGVEFAEKVRANRSTVNVEVILEEDQVHDWFVVLNVVKRNLRPELVARAVRAWGKFVKECLDAVEGNSGVVESKLEGVVDNKEGMDSEGK